MSLLPRECSLQCTIEKRRLRHRIAVLEAEGLKVEAVLKAAREQKDEHWHGGPPCDCGVCVAVRALDREGGNG